MSATTRPESLIDRHRNDDTRKDHTMTKAHAVLHEARSAARAGVRPTFHQLPWEVADDLYARGIATQEERDIIAEREPGDFDLGFLADVLAKGGA